MAAGAEHIWRLGKTVFWPQSVHGSVLPELPRPETAKGLSTLRRFLFEQKKLCFENIQISFKDSKFQIAKVSKFPDFQMFIFFNLPTFQIWKHGLKQLSF